MSQQPNLFSSNAPPGPKVGPGPASAGPVSPPQQKKLPWMQRTDLIVRVAVRLYLGLLVLVLPWTQMWNENHWLNIAPYLSAIALSGIARGLVSGLGLLNIWIAVMEAIHYREQ
jgi:polyferredoxin